jgi:hypothetical protein
MLCYHGSPSSNVDVILSTTDGEELDKIFEGRSADILAGGHSHIQMLRRHGRQAIINPGSVGNAFLRPFQPGVVPTLLPWAEYAIVSVDSTGWGANLRRVRFDTQAILRLAQSMDIPSRDWKLDMYSQE